MPLFRRQKVLLGVLLEAPCVPTWAELAGWVFFLKQETPFSSDPSFYEFIPQQNGPQSFTMHHDLDKLARLGYTKREGLGIHPDLASETREIFFSLPPNVRRGVYAVIKKYSCLPQAQLLSIIGEKFPWALPNTQRKLSCIKKNPTAYTAGYEGKSIESFLAGLFRNGIERIIDVRKNPVSRKYGFSRYSLARLCTGVGIEYVHMPALGIPSSQRKARKTSEDYQKLFWYYENTILPSVQETVREAARLVESRSSALMCFEADSRCCHRARLANTLAASTGLEVVHLK